MENENLHVYSGKLIPSIYDLGTTPIQAEIDKVKTIFFDYSHYFEWFYVLGGLDMS